MASQPEYTAAANALLHILDAYVTQNVPTTFGYQQRAIAAMPAIAGHLAQVAVDTVDAYRRANAPPPLPTSLLETGKS